MPACLPGVGEAPFDSERKRMSTLHTSGRELLLFVKGAPETVIDRCSDVATPNGSPVVLQGELRTHLAEQAENMAAKGMRVLALALRRLNQLPHQIESTEDDLTLVGFVGLRDPVRAEAAAAVRDAQEAGIRLIMVTRRPSAYRGNHSPGDRHLEFRGWSRDGERARPRGCQPPRPKCGCTRASTPTTSSRSSRVCAGRAGSSRLRVTASTTPRAAARRHWHRDGPVGDGCSAGGGRHGYHRRQPLDDYHRRP